MRGSPVHSSVLFDPLSTRCNHFLGPLVRGASSSTRRLQTERTMRDVRAWVCLAVCASAGLLWGMWSFRSDGERLGGRRWWWRQRRYAGRRSRSGPPATVEVEATEAFMDAGTREPTAAALATAGSRRRRRRQRRSRRRRRRQRRSRRRRRRQRRSRRPAVDSAGPTDSASGVDAKEAGGGTDSAGGDTGADTGGDAGGVPTPDGGYGSSGDGGACSSSLASRVRITEVDVGVTYLYNEVDSNGAGLGLTLLAISPIPGLSPGVPRKRRRDGARGDAGRERPARGRLRVRASGVRFPGHLRRQERRHAPGEPVGAGFHRQQQLRQHQ